MEVAAAGVPAAADGVTSLQPCENNYQIADSPVPQHSPAVEEENAYERERMERIKRNEEVMRQMGLRELAANALAPAQPGSEAKKKRRARAAPAPAAAPSGPRRVSARTRKDAPEHQAADHKEINAEDSGAAAAALMDEELLVSMEEYFKNNENLSSVPRTDGVYRGWVASRVVEKFGIAASEEAAAAAVATAKRQKLGSGRTAARDFAATQLRNNPNAFFYRHVAPDQQQAQGEWTEEEHRQFMEVVRHHGVGDRWGLFASHIPQRVGYQCSAYYRDVVLAAGLVIDERFKMTPSGKAVFSARG